ncbi:MAG: uncharacterized protein JWL62_369, partial [Hyphomicrobiales bacterium]|nr:uncharacterized protein [Hyphomicrobiales bacterium]
ICPFKLDVLDGAVLAEGNICDVPKADCRIDPAGLWGPSGGSIRGDLLPRIERSRRQADDQVRATFKALLASTRDKAEIKRVAAAQAGFSSRREEVCTKYRREDVHGFCAARLTEARAFALRAEYDRLAGGAPKAKPVARKPAPPKPSTLFAPPPGPASNLY